MVVGGEAESPVGSKALEDYVSVSPITVMVKITSCSTFCYRTDKNENISIVP